VSPQLVAGNRTLTLDRAPLLMGVVNASPDSFSDGGEWATLEDQFEHARSLVDAGAAILDIGGESGVTNTPPVPPDVEVERVVPLIARIAEELDVLVSVDTYKPAVAREAIAAGAGLVNDWSGLTDPSMAEVCGLSGAALVIAYNRGEPKEKLFDQRLDGLIVEDGVAFLRERVTIAEANGVQPEQILIDPGPDVSKTPYQTVRLLRGLRELESFDRPLLLAVSRKDFLGVITERPPAQRDAATLAAIGYGLDMGAHVVRVHDVAAAADFIAVRAVLGGDVEIAPDARLAEDLRREPAR
jgi:dihydropteroate synthase